MCKITTPLAFKQGIIYRGKIMERTRFIMPTKEQFKQLKEISTSIPEFTSK